MARDEQEFMGIPARFAEPSGADPNYSGGYRGMRMSGGHGRAAYGDYRLIHDHDLETAGGYPGLHGRRGGHAAPRFDPRWEDSGYVGDTHDPQIARDFDSRSPMYSDPDRDGTGTDLEHRAEALPERRWMPEQGYRPAYSNRGVTGAGYSEGWARGPMRGAR